MSELETPRPRRRLGLVKAPPTRAETLAAITAELRPLSEAEARARFGLAGERLLKTTASLCPACLRHVPAAVYVRGAQVRMRKRCPEHGASEAVLENDVRYYFLSNKDRTGRAYADDLVFDIPAYTLPGQASCCDDGACGPGAATDQSANKTCTILVEVTNACNLACTVCYSDAKGDRKLPLEDFERHLGKLIRERGGLDSVQLTGGEALMHPEVDRMIAFLHAQPGVKKVYLPTNGLLLAKPGRAKSLARYRDKLLVLLQFDGEDETNRALRQATPARVRDRVIALCAEAGLFMQLTMTLAAGVNDDEVGWVLDTALRHEHVKVVALQPATYSGRYELPPDAEARLTLSDVVKAVHRQASLRVAEEDFVPIPCSHPNCGWITLFVRRFGLVANVMKHVDLPRVLDQVSYKTMMSTGELRAAMATEGSPVKRALARAARSLVRSSDVFTIAVKPFMDRFSYDQDRVANCCHHTMSLDGGAVSFCEHNALLRPDEPWARLPPLAD